MRHSVEHLVERRRRLRRLRPRAGPLVRRLRPAHAAVQSGALQQRRQLRQLQAEGIRVSAASKGRPPIGAVGGEVLRRRRLLRRPRLLRQEPRGRGDLLGGIADTHLELRQIQRQPRREHGQRELRHRGHPGRSSLRRRADLRRQHRPLRHEEGLRRRDILPLALMIQRQGRRGPRRRHAVRPGHRAPLIQELQEHREGEDEHGGHQPRGDELGRRAEADDAAGV
mmetsp:Transcript_52604/g.153333  ORF Transcript_52604/g.153333 Transcript_52604/m.153333 type:complete len:225 (-) Transcript_52604:611-1285(-)